MKVGTSSAAKMVSNFLEWSIFTAFSFAVQDTHLLVFFVLDPRVCLLGHIREAPSMNIFIKLYTIVSSNICTSTPEIAL